MKSKTYNTQLHSILDIEQYLDALNLKTNIVIGEDNLSHELHIVGTNINIEFPSYDINRLIFASIRFNDDYPRNENHEKDKKLYEKLKRKFGQKSNESNRFIKDKEKMDELLIK